MINPVDGWNKQALVCYGMVIIALVFYGYAQRAGIHHCRPALTTLICNDKQTLEQICVIEYKGTVYE